jgi:hypothetical protein
MRNCYFERNKLFANYNQYLTFDKFNETNKKILPSTHILMYSKKRGVGKGFNIISLGLQMP